MDEKDVAPGFLENVFFQLFAPSNGRLPPFEDFPASLTMLRTQWCTRLPRYLDGPAVFFCDFSYSTPQ
jgi:hypothetical protein